MFGDNEAVETVVPPTDANAEPVEAPADAVVPPTETAPEAAPATPEAPVAAEPAPAPEAPKAEEPKCDCTAEMRTYAKLGNVRNAARLDFKRVCVHEATKLGGEPLTADNAATLRSEYDHRVPEFKAELLRELERRLAAPPENAEPVAMTFDDAGLDAVAAEQAKLDAERRAAREDAFDAEVEAFRSGRIVPKLVSHSRAERREDQRCAWSGIGCTRRFDGRPFDRKAKKGDKEVVETVQRRGGGVGVYRRPRYLACHHHMKVAARASYLVRSSGLVPAFHYSEDLRHVDEFLSRGPRAARGEGRKVGTHGRREGGAGEQGGAASGGASGNGGSKPSGSSASAQTVVVERRRSYHMPDEDRGEAGKTSAYVDLPEVNARSAKKKAADRADRANGGR